MKQYGDFGQKSKKGGRPGLAEEEKRNTVIRFRVTSAEHDFIKKNASQTLLSTSQYCRSAVLKRTITPRIDQDFHTQIIRIGHNINQMTRKLNANGQLNEYDREGLNRLYSILKEINMKF